jgi:hypothetical protein
VVFPTSARGVPTSQQPGIPQQSVAFNGLYFQHPTEGMGRSPQQEGFLLSCGLALPHSRSLGISDRVGSSLPRPAEGALGILPSVSALGYSHMSGSGCLQRSHISPQSVGLALVHRKGFPQMVKSGLTIWAKSVLVFSQRASMVVQRDSIISLTECSWYLQQSGFPRFALVTESSAGILTEEFPHEEGLVSPQ